MSRADEDAVWEWQPTGQLDEDGEDCGDYVLVGSQPLTPFEAMLLAAAGATYSRHEEFRHALHD